MQGIPQFDDSLKAMKPEVPLFNPNVVSQAAQRRLAGNAFHLACSTAFMAFILPFLEKRSRVGALMNTLESQGAVECESQASQEEGPESEDEVGEEADGDIN